MPSWLSAWRLDLAVADRARQRQRQLGLRLCAEWIALELQRRRTVDDRRQRRAGLAGGGGAGDRALGGGGGDAVVAGGTACEARRPAARVRRRLSSSPRPGAPERSIGLLLGALAGVASTSTRRQQQLEPLLLDRFGGEGESAAEVVEAAALA